MVSQITEGSALDRHGRPFLRRDPRPAIYLLIGLLVATGVAWTVALTRPPEVPEAAACNAPPSPAEPGQKLGTPVSVSTMIDVAPAALTATKVRVLNASGRAGQAGEVADTMRDLGFAQPAAANDPLYANTKLDCLGQIRFGSNGQAGAAAVWLVAPCAQLLRDTRTDDSVDLALGTDFTALAHSDDINTALAGLRRDATADSALLTKIHSAVC